MTPAGLEEFERLLPARLRLASLVIFIAGLLAAAAVFLSTTDNPAEREGYETVVVDGTLYTVPTPWTKDYLRALERFGGGASVMADRFDRWFSGLWHGRALAYTIFWLTLLVSGCLRLVANRMAAVQAAERAARDRRDRRTQSTID